MQEYYVPLLSCYYMQNEQKEGTDEKENLPLVTKALQSKLQVTYYFFSLSRCV